MLVGRTEGLSLDSGDSRILWDNHFIELLCGPGGESLHRVCEAGRVGHAILELLIEGTSGLGLTEWHVR